MSDKQTAGQKMAAEISALMRARNALLWVVTTEEARVERALFEIAKSRSAEVRLWDCVTGVTDLTGKEVAPGREGSAPEVVLSVIRDSDQLAIWILRDFPRWLTGPLELRALRNLARSLPRSPVLEARTVVILSPDSRVPPELSDHAVVVKWPLPDRDEVARIFDGQVANLSPEVAARCQAQREAAIEAAVGLTEEAARSCYANSLVTQKCIVPAVVAAEKKRVINKEKGVEWFDPDPRGLAAVGGLDNLKPWLELRRLGFSQEARAFGLPPPKGVMLVGVAGCGKSLIAKSIASAWGMPLLRADFGGAKSKWVGESEANIRAIFQIAETVGNCVLWIDEIEKALGGATDGAADGGVSKDALGAFLSWMQDRKGSVFVIATANDVSALPPELLRKGRFDEMFFVDLPTSTERQEILRVHLKRVQRELPPADVAAVAAACKDFTGSEIEAIVPDALFAAFADKSRALTVDDLLAAARSVTPLAQTAKEKIEKLREWAKSRARRASKLEETVSLAVDRQIEM